MEVVIYEDDNNSGQPFHQLETISTEIKESRVEQDFGLSDSLGDLAGHSWPQT